MTAPHQKARDAVDHLHDSLSSYGFKLTEDDMEAIETLRKVLSRSAISPTEQKPVAVIGRDWQLLWASADILSSIVAEHGLKIGDALYTRPPEQGGVLEWRDNFLHFNGKHIGHTFKNGDGGGYYWLSNQSVICNSEHEARQVLETAARQWLSLSGGMGSDDSPMSSPSAVSVPSTGVHPDMSAQQLKIHLGEMTAQEERTARAAIRLAQGQPKTLEPHPLSDIPGCVAIDFKEPPLSAKTEAYLKEIDDNIRAAHASAADFRLGSKTSSPKSEQGEPATTDRSVTSEPNTIVVSREDLRLAVCFVNDAKRFVPPGEYGHSMDPSVSEAVSRLSQALQVKP